MESSTKILRRMLDERGVEWWLSDDPCCEDIITHWRVGPFQWTAIEGEKDLWLNAGIAGHEPLTPEQAIAATLGAKVTGETSDGYHTFNELYHHRAVLFSVIVRDHRELAWKSKLHHDGTMYDGMFIVGIETPNGQATYHYDINPYWDMFDCRELERAPEWDGHTPSEAIERISTLGRGECHNESKATEYFFYCSECGCAHLRNQAYVDMPRYCPNCGAKVVDE